MVLQHAGPSRINDGRNAGLMAQESGSMRQAAPFNPNQYLDDERAARDAFNIGIKFNQPVKDRVGGQFKMLKRHTLQHQ